jgi:hypothetical protein
MLAKADGPNADDVRDALADLPTMLRYLVSSDRDPEVVEAATEVLGTGLSAES